MSDQASQPPPDPFDACFAQTKRPSGDLGARARAVRERAMREPAVSLEEWLETELARWPVAPRSGSQDATLARIRRASKGGRIELWRLLPALSAGLAACVVLGLGQPSRPPEPDSGAFPMTAAATAETSRPPAVELDLDPEAARILALAQGLEQPSRWLLDEGHLTTLATALP